MKRGQITLLVIIGIILLFTVSLLLYFSRTFQTDQLQAQAQDTVNDFIESNSLSQYITTCLQRVATEGVDLLSKQGGVIYTSQGGRIETPTRPLDLKHLVYQGYNISYAIKDISASQCANYRDDQLFNWDYPVQGVLFNEFPSRFLSTIDEGGCRYVGSTKDLRKSGYLGYNTFSYLCTEETANEYDYNELPIQRTIICRSDYREPLTFQGENPSIETQLEWYIEDNMQNCFNVSIYEQVGDEITVDQENFDAQVYFTDPRGIFVRSTFPFEVSIKGQKPIVELVNFQQSIDINFLDTYNFMYELIQEMVRNPSFDFHSQSYEEWESYRGKGLNVELIPALAQANSNNPISPVYDDILRVTNTQEELNGEPYFFQVAIRQRRPVLNYISQGNFPFQDEQGNPITVDFVLYPGQPLEFDINAMDPNYDAYEINITGWKQTQDSIFDSQCCEERSDCTLTNLGSCLITTQTHPNLNMEQCRQNLASCLANIDDTTNVVLYQNNPYQPKILEQQYLQNGGSIRYVPDETDSGLHKITINVTDEHGSYDFQDIYVLVYDYPIARLILRSIYDDILAESASVEDPYILDPTESQASAFSERGELSAFIYRGYYAGYESGDWDFENISTENTPIILPFGAYDILSIPQQEFNENLLDGLQPGEVKQVDISLEVNQDIGGRIITSLPTIEQTNLYECLPHGFNPQNAPTGSTDLIEYYDTTIYETAASPYYQKYTNNNLLASEDVFQMPHVCCEPIEGLSQTPPLTGGVYADDDELCYFTSKDACFPPLDDAIYIEEFLKSPLTQDAQGNTFILENVDGFQRNPASPYANGGNSPFSNAINDVYILTQEQECSGTRGNICSGDIQLTWELAPDGQCNDLDASIGQYARCEGPGYIYANPSDDRCYQGYDLSCLSYGGRSSFERNILGVNSFNSQGYDATTATAIGQGFCAGPRTANLNQIVNGNIPAGVPGDFICYGTCGTGDCSFRESSCFCPAQTGSPSGGSLGLSSVTASQFTFALNSKSFSCDRTTQLAYDSTCQVLPTDSKESCFCQNERPTNGVRQGNFDSFNEYFGEKDGDWNIVDIQGQNRACCQQGVYAVIQGSDMGTDTSLSVCYDGIVRDSGNIFTYAPVSGQNDFLSYQGKVYYCAQQETESFVTAVRNNNLGAASSIEAIYYSQEEYGLNDITYPHQFTSWNCTDAGWVNS